MLILVAREEFLMVMVIIGYQDFGMVVQVLPITMVGLHQQIGGIEIGFGAEVSQLITAQTIKGAARLILECSNHPEKEIDKVTTPMGVTISGLNEMEHQGFSSAVIKGLLTSFNKLDMVETKN